MSGFVTYKTTMQLDCSYRELSDWVERQYPGQMLGRGFRVGFAEIKLVSYTPYPEYFEFIFDIQASEICEKTITTFINTINDVFGEKLTEMVRIFLRHPSKVMARGIFRKAQKHLVLVWSKQ